MKPPTVYNFAQVTSLSHFLKDKNTTKYFRPKNYLVYNYDNPYMT